ncbi:hypothetical protein SAMN05660845_1658 [Flavobacterium swingsii]|uniref:Uncharacterized protein n=1 Tax=Flavobacterium swingsii TaxID=498292 RepID=A0A1I0YCL1_9FLAO|nr:hypothetical protein [Flavobacterium swingsii]SFB11001.1 hypothetical protein SAMN05660845_1658 [Flavobacterium swingsii]
MKKSELKEEIIISFYFNIPISVITYLTTKNLLISLIAFCLITFFVISFGLLTKKLGYKRHCEIIESESFKKLISLGFKVEKVNKYRGITGNYKGFIFDIYYDWLTYVDRNRSSALIFNVYFERIETEQNIINHKKLTELNTKYANSKWSLLPCKYLIIWRNGNIIMKTPIIINKLTSDFIIKKMNVAIEILKTENLQPVNELKISEWRKEDEYVNTPEILVYRKENIR